MIDFRKCLPGSSCLALCLLIVITPALGVEQDGEIPLPPSVEEDSQHFESRFSIVKRAASGLLCDFQRIFGWCQDHGEDQQKRSSPEERTERQDDNTNPDEPNPKILVRVPRTKRHGSHSRSGGGKSRGRGSRVINLDKKPERKRFSKKGGAVTVAHLKSRRFGGRGGTRRKSKRIVVNGKWYGPKIKLEGNSTEPPPRVIDHLAHLRKALTGAALLKQQRRFVTNKAFLYRKAKKDRARKENARLAKLRKRMKKKKKKKKKKKENQAAKEDDVFDSYSSSSFSSSSYSSYYYSSSSSSSDGGSASEDAANVDDSTDEVKQDYKSNNQTVTAVKKKKPKSKPKRPPKPKFAWKKHKHSHSHSKSHSHGHHSHGHHSHGHHSHGHSHGNKKGRRWKKTFRPIKMKFRGRR